MLLPIASLWPNIFLGGTTDAFGWAYCIGRCCCRLLCFGPIYFWEALLMHSDGPIALADAAADCFALAHYLFVRHFRCIHMGPLHWQILLLIASLRPIIFLIHADDAQGWAHYISRCCCGWLRFSPLFFRSAADAFSCAHCIGECCCQWLHFDPKYGSQICFRYRWISVKQNVPLDLPFSVRFCKHTLLHQPIFYLNYAATQCASAGGVCADQCP